MSATTIHRICHVLHRRDPSDAHRPPYIYSTHRRYPGRHSSTGRDVVDVVVWQAATVVRQMQKTVAAAASVAMILLGGGIFAQTSSTSSAVVFAAAAGGQSDFDDSGQRQIGVIIGLIFGLGLVAMVAFTLVGRHLQERARIRAGIPPGRAPASCIPDVIGMLPCFKLTEPEHYNAAFAAVPMMGIGSNGSGNGTGVNPNLAAVFEYQQQLAQQQLQWQLQQQQQQGMQHHGTGVSPGQMQPQHGMVGHGGGAPINPMLAFALQHQQQLAQQQQQWQQQQQSVSPVNLYKA